MDVVHAGDVRPSSNRGCLKTLAFVACASAGLVALLLPAVKAARRAAEASQFS